MSTRLNDPKTGVRVVIMQRVHGDDLSGHVLAQGGYDHLCLPAEYEEGHSIITSIGWSDPRIVEGELLWPERFGQAEIEALKQSMGSYAVAGQLQQRPAPAEGGIFKRHWWRYWKPRGISLPAVAVRYPSGEIQHVQAVDLPAQFEALGQTWDMASRTWRRAILSLGRFGARRARIATCSIRRRSGWISLARCALSGP